MYIKVDHSKFEMAASSIDTYILDIKGKMASIDGEMSTLSNSWGGKDFTQFNLKWMELTNSNSIYDKTLKSLDAYAAFLRYAAEQYKNAQASAINRANALPW